MKIYCMECNAPSEYSDIKPKFCSSCGEPFNKTSQAKIIHKLPQRKKRREIEEDDEYDEGDELNTSFNIGKIEIEPLRGNLHGVEKFEEIITQSPVDSPRKPNKQKTKISKKQFEKLWASELTDKTSKEIGV